MKFSKANLSIIAVAGREPTDPELMRVHFAHDGSTVAANGWALLAVSPVPKSRAKEFPDIGEPDKRPPEAGVGVPTKTVADAMKNLPTDKRPQFQHAQMTKCSPTRVELMTTNGSNATKVSATPVPGKFPEWQAILAEARECETKARVCIDRRRLITILQAIDKACEDPGNLNPTYIEIGGPNDPIVIRAKNDETLQRVVGIVTPIDTGGKWLKAGKWEKRMEGGGGVKEV